MIQEVGEFGQDIFTNVMLNFLLVPFLSYLRLQVDEYKVAGVAGIPICCTYGNMVHLFKIRLPDCIRKRIYCPRTLSAADTVAI